MPDNELDDLFRKAAGESNAEFEPEAWKRMEQLLDERDGRTGGYWWKGILLLLTLLLVGTLGFVWLRKPDAPAGSPVGDNRQAAPAAGNRSAAGNAGPESDLPAGRDAAARSRTGKPGNDGIAAHDGNATDGKGTRKPLAANGRAASEKTATTGQEAKEGAGKTGNLDGRGKAAPESTGERSSADRLPTGAGNRQHASHEKTGIAGKRVPALATTGPNRLRPGTLRERPAARSKRTGQTETRSGNAPPGPTGGVRGRNPTDALANNGPGQAPATPQPGAGPESAVLPADATLPELAFLTGKPLVAAPPEFGRPAVPPPAAREKPPVEPVAKPLRPAGRLRAGVMVSPDLSSIGLSGHLTVGTNTGVQLEYRLTNRFRVGVGALYSVKLYSAEVEDYTVPYGFWSYGVAPSEIEANCKILDLPVHLRFDALRRARYTAFVSTGLSSYIMLSERYGYYYPTYNPYLRPEWRGKRTGEHYLSVVNLSVGYERDLGRRFSWQAEPFLKLPLGGVGFGKVRLGSSGVFVSLKYKIGKQDQ
jgi:hypothetical protein